MISKTLFNGRFKPGRNQETDTRIIGKVMF